MEKLDKNYIIGFILLFLMYGTYIYFNDSLTPPAEPAKNTASVAKKVITDTTSSKVISISDSSSVNIAEQLITAENENIKVTISSKGAKIVKVELKNYKTFDAYKANKTESMVLFDGSNTSSDFLLPTNAGDISLSKINFSASKTNISVKGDKAESVVFSFPISGGKIEKTYTISGKGYEIKQDLKTEGLSSVLKNAPSTIIWENPMLVLENDLSENRKAAQINYFDKEETFEDLGLGSTSDENETADLPVKWFSFKQKYFTSGVVSENGFFEKGQFDLKTPQEDSSIVKIGKITAQIPFTDLSQNKVSLKYYFGPNDLEALKSVGNDFQKNLYLGYDIVKPVNLYVFVPLFNWVESFITNYGLLIIIVVLMIKITLTPLIYKSYVSSAKMRVLAPEIAAIKEKVGDDAVKVQQETMKLYQQVGVSPLSGCVPLLLQMPILMSVFFLFPNMLMFRQKNFLWANDLSTYDSLINWGFNLPIIGHHISLFVVLMTISSLAFTYYNNQVTPDQPGPVDMKKLSYIFPLVFFFVLNSFPAALSFYYLVSNVVTIAQQLIVRKFIDEDKILTILEKNRKNYHTKPQKKSKFGDFIQKQLQASEEMKKQSSELKNSRKKK
ncbi:membrane protein insertase YidC [Lacihabitans sp. CS3-21]|uniref:membrane protein insertase YidC n=1 Tax=Lacihabitans sp. CS3-21 TaxID=2487332 RepID=UPI0020CF5C27|nr:membrane protein insertase YidC [Lacihabitans sp. CS3-21]MCP9746337.1 membrane protein insertase YidC [Lacihabitans sp. CS3-21]